MVRFIFMFVFLISLSNDLDINFEEIARCTTDFNGAQLKAVCVEAGMIALRRKGDIIKHEDFMEGMSKINHSYIYSY